MAPFIGSRKAAAGGARPLSWGRSGNRAVEACSGQGTGTAGRPGGGGVHVLNNFK